VKKAKRHNSTTTGVW